MRCISILVLALVTGIPALAQQSLEWRPSVAEDNKAATWKDTALFLSNTLTKYSQEIEIDGSVAEVSSVTSTNECTLNVGTHASVVQGSACKQLQGTPEGILGVTLSPLSPEVAARVGGVGYLIEGFRPGSLVGNSRIEVGSVLISVELRRKYSSTPQWFHLRSPQDLQNMVHSEIWDSATRVKLVLKDKANGYKTRFVEVEFDGACEAPRTFDELCTIELAKIDPLSIELTNSRLTFSGTNNESFGSCARQSEPNSSTSKIDRGLKLQLSDLDIAKRTGRAFLHAAILCGGTKAVSPF